VQVTTTTKPKPARVKYGIATWYRWHPGQCATSYLPKGTHIKIRSLRTGRVVYCVVTDSQPYSKDRIVDLDVHQFSKLAPLSRGVEHVVVTW
jgi:rare lipoprotein A (peptidoglycan hydrolase)